MITIVSPVCSLGLVRFHQVGNLPFSALTNSVDLFLVFVLCRLQPTPLPFSGYTYLIDGFNLFCYVLGQ